MKLKLCLLIVICLIIKVGSLSAQTVPETYVWPKDPKVMENLNNG